MMRRFTMIQGGLTRPAPAGTPSKDKLEAVGAVLRERLASLQIEPAPVPARPARLTATRRPIPGGAFLGIRPDGWGPDVAA